MADDIYQSYLDHPETIPFCFTYDGTDYRGFSPTRFTLLDRETAISDGKETVTM